MTSVSTSHVTVLDGTDVPDRELIGGKAWSIARMRQLGLRVPPAFVLPVAECRRYHGNSGSLDDEVWAQVLEGVQVLEAATGRRFGDPGAPLLVSVRSGAAVSMPGMMDTVLNLGITAEVERGLALLTGDPDHARDTRARFCHQFGEIVLKADLDPYVSGRVPDEVCAEILADTDESVPDDPHAQLRAAICAVFDSWMSARARSYRRHWGIPEDGGTAVTVQAMVFGNLGDRSGTGVLFTRNPLSGEPTPYGEWLPGGQGDDVVSGTHAVQDLATLGATMPTVHEELLRWARVLEREHSEVQDIEFTVEGGRLYLLQTRTAKRSPAAAVRIAVDLVDEGVLTPAQALTRVTPEQLASVLLPRLDPRAVEAATILATGEPACPGVACGIGVMDPDEAEARARAGEQIVLVRPTTSPNDVHGMIAAVAVVTDLGGSTSHAAVVTRGLGRTSVVGVGTGVTKGLVGRTVTVDGASGRVYDGRLPLVATRVDDDPALSRLATWAEQRCPVSVVSTAPDGVEVYDLDAHGFGPGQGSSAPTVDELVDRLRGRAAASGAVLATAVGVEAILAAELPCVVAAVPLPLRLRLVQAAGR
ncbi:MAG TPA: pyruvate, phosphate dikinase [Mycobacteriales bacterium]